VVLCCRWAVQAGNAAGRCGGNRVRAASAGNRCERHHAAPASRRRRVCVQGRVWHAVRRAPRAKRLRWGAVGRRLRMEAAPPG